MRQIDRHVLSLHEQINDLRSKHHLRILWPDYECYSLLQASVKVETLPWYVSAQGTLKIVQIPKSSLLTSEVILDDFTHLCISNYKAYGKSNEEETMLALIFSNRSFAVDSISLRQTGENSHPIILIQLDETNLKIRLWGCGLIAQNETIVTPTYVTRQRHIIYIEYPALHQYKSLILYGTRQSPVYGSKYYQANTLTSEAVVIYTMPFIVFDSYLQTQINSKAKDVLKQFRGSFKPNQKEQLESIQQTLRKSVSKMKILSEKIPSNIIRRSNSVQKQMPTNTNQIKGFRIIKNQIPVQVNPYSLKRNKRHIIYLKILIKGLAKEYSDIVSQNKCSLSTEQEIITLRCKNASVDVQGHRLKFFCKNVDINIQNRSFFRLDYPLAVLQALQNALKGANLQNILSKLTAQNLLLPFLSFCKQIQCPILLNIMLIESVINLCSKTLPTQWWVDLMNTIDLTDHKIVLVQTLEDFFVNNSLEVIRCNEEKLKSISTEKLLELFHKSLQYVEDISSVTDLLELRMSLLPEKSFMQYILEMSKKKSGTAGCIVKITEPVIDIINSSLSFALELPSQQIVKGFFGVKLNSSAILKENYCFKSILTFNVSLTLSTNKYQQLTCQQFSLQNERYKFSLIMTQIQAFAMLQRLQSIVEPSNDINASSFEVHIDVQINEQSYEFNYFTSFPKGCNAMFGIRSEIKETKQVQKVQIGIKMAKQYLHSACLAYVSARFSQLSYLQAEKTVAICSYNNPRSSQLGLRESCMKLEEGLQTFSDSAKSIPETCIHHKKCQQCEILCQESIYLLHFHQIKTLLASPKLTIQSQAHLLKFIVKYIHVQCCDEQQIESLLSFIRLNFVPMAKLLQFHQNDTVLQHSKAYNDLINTKIHRLANIDVNKKQQRFFDSPRTNQDIWRFYEPDFSQQLLKYRGQMK